MPDLIPVQKSPPPAPKGMKPLSATAQKVLDRIKGFERTPDSVVQTVTCPIHGEISYVTYQRPDGTWKDPVCPVCAERKKRVIALTNAAAQLATENVRDLESGLAVPCPIDSSLLTFRNFIADTPEQAKVLKVARLFAQHFRTREVKRLVGLDEGDPNWKYENARNLVFTGGYGTGKTHLAMAILSYIREAGFPGFYIKVADLMDAMLRDSVDRGRMLRILQAVPCLVLDEVGVQSGTAHEQKRLFQIVDGRIQQGRPTIFISNLDLDKFIEFVSPRVYSRIFACAYHCKFTWTSRRQLRAAERELSIEEMFS